MAFGNYTAGTPTAPTGTHVPAGDYKLRVVEAKADTSKASGNDMVKLKLRVVKPDGSEGSALFDYLVFQDSSHWKIDAFLKSAGAHPGEGNPFPFEPDAMDEIDGMVGLEVQATLKVETYDGKTNNKVVSYLFDEDEDFK